MYTLVLPQKNLYCRFLRKTIHISLAFIILFFFENLPSSMCVFCIFVCMSVSHSLCVYAKVPVEALELEL